jgi:hypothetical protein
VSICKRVQSGRGEFVIRIVRSVPPGVLLYQHEMLIREELLQDCLGYPLQPLYEDVGANLEGLVEYDVTNIVRGQYAVRARHRIIAQIV